jgi:hypothetical protein
VLVDISKLDHALEVARIFLGLDPVEAQHRLSEILVEEVSLVDRAANRRRFLVVKHGGTMEGDSRAAEEQPTAKAELSLPTPVKEGLMRVVTEATERLVSIGNMIRGAQETAEANAQPVPAELATEVQTISDLLRGALSRYPSPMSDGAAAEPGEAAMAEKAGGAVAQALSTIAATASEIAQRASGAETLDGATLAAVRNLAAQLNALAERYPQPTAGAAPSGAVEMEKESATSEKATETATAVAPPVVAEAGAVLAAPAEQESHKEMDTKLSRVGSEAGDKLAVIAQAITRIAEATTPDELVSIRNQVAGVAKSLTGLSDDELETVSKAVGPSRLMRVLAALRPIFAMLEQTEGTAGDETPGAALADAATPVTATADTAKRSAETQPSPPAREGGNLGNVGSGPTADKAAKDGPTDDPMTAVMKRLDTMERTLAAAPEAPASRSEAPTQGKGDGSTDRSRSGRRGGPWIM